VTTLQSDTSFLVPSLDFFLELLMLGVIGVVCAAALTWLIVRVTRTPSDS
jgi:hypothetical protein